MATLTEKQIEANRQKLERELQIILKSFEGAKEWADLSNCLYRLHREILNSKTGGIDNMDQSLKRVICRRLAQCLHPSFPAGVHMKALETYNAIFEMLGADGLLADLGMFSSGIFPFVQHAATHVQGVYAILLEQHYLPLGLRLAPCLTGLLVCLLPVVEDQKSPAFSRFHQILLALSAGVGEKVFISALWVVLLRTSRCRVSGIALVDYVLADAMRLRTGRPAAHSLADPLERLQSSDSVLGTDAVPDPADERDAEDAPPPLPLSIEEVGEEKVDALLPAARPSSYERCSKSWTIRTSS
jgi:hypothetical protein